MDAANVQVFYREIMLRVVADFRAFLARNLALYHDDQVCGASALAHSATAAHIRRCVSVGT